MKHDLFTRLNHTIVACGDLANLVSPYLAHGGLICLVVPLDGDLGRHAAHGGYLSPDCSRLNRNGNVQQRLDVLVTCLDEEPDIRIHEADLHGDVLAVREHCSRVGAPFLDEAKDIVPAMCGRT